ncbi:MAG: DUF6973 domain-containing protein [Aeromonas sp.]
MKKKLILSVCILMITTTFITPLTTHAQELSIKEELNVTVEQFKNNEKFQQQLKDEVSNTLTQEQIDFYNYVKQLKIENTNLSVDELVNIIDWGKLEQADRNAKIPKNYRNFDIEILAAGAEGSSLSDTWNRLTPAEKVLVALYPSEALMVKSCQSTTDTYVQSVYGWHKDGSEPNAYRHALWNALMSAKVGKGLAAKFATAHEAYSDAELDSAGSWFGFTARQHTNMDLHNNQKGRDCVSWYEVFISNDTASQRVLEKISNDEMIILVK